MMKKIYIVLLFLFILTRAQSQNIGIGTASPAEKLDVSGNTRVSGYIRSQAISLHATTGFIPDASAIIDMVSTNQGVLVPRMTEAQRNSISLPAPGLLIYQTNPDSKGFYFNNGTSAAPQWLKVGKENTGKGVQSFPNGFGNTFTVPSGISSIEFEAAASGGGGGGGQVFNGTHCGYGAAGGAGAYYSGFLKVNPGDIITVVVGAAGTGGATNTTPVAGTNGGNAASTTISINGVLVLELGGGQGGSGGVCNGSVFIGNTVGGPGGFVLFSDINYVTGYLGAGGYSGGGGSSNLLNSSLSSGGFVVSAGQFNTLNTAGRPSSGLGGAGGNNALNGAAGISGYVKLKY